MNFYTLVLYRSLDSPRSSPRWSDNQVVLDQVESIVADVDTVILFRDSGVGRACSITQE